MREGALCWRKIHLFCKRLHPLSIMVQQMHLYIIKQFKMPHIKTLKSTPTCFDHQLIINRELICS
jgi:hypothetical protein